MSEGCSAVGCLLYRLAVAAVAAVAVKSVILLMA
jgi:hypothetical protein